MNFMKTKKRNPPKKEDFLKKALLEAQINDPDLIDSYIYAINAATLRYKVLLHEVKNISGDNSSTSHRKEA